MNIAKLFSLVMLFKDVTSEFAAKGQDRPWYMQRTVVGAIVTALAGVAAIYTGITIDAAALSKITDSVPQLVSVGTTLYGSALMIYGLFKKATK